VDHLWYQGCNTKAIQEKEEEKMAEYMSETTSSSKQTHDLTVTAGYGNDYLPWLYTQPLQPKGGC
jgi:hypothetical protein